MEIPTTRMTMLVAQDEEEYRLGHGFYLTIDHNDPNLHGSLVNTLSKGQFPFWLAIGIELVSRNALGMFEPTDILQPYDFGNMSFQPVFWGTTDQENAQNIAFHFTSYLLENDHLSSLINMYKTNQNENADNFANELFYSHFGHEMGVPWGLHFINMQANAQSGTLYTISIRTELAEFHIAFGNAKQYFTVERINEKIDYFHGAIIFTRDLYSDFVNVELRHFPIRFIMSYESNITTTATADFNGIINLRGLGGDRGYRVLLVAAHELSHIFNGTLLFCPFDEGFADVANFWFNQKFALNYPIFANSDHQTIEDMRALTSEFVHLRAHFRLYFEEHLLNRGFVWRYTDPHADNYIAEINTYNTAFSFVLYLIDTYGLDKYMQVHWNKNNFDNVYGKSIYEAIEQWQLFLEDLAFNFREADPDMWEEYVESFKLGMAFRLGQN